jgi:hypothetical protein
MVEMAAMELGYWRRLCGPLMVVALPATTVFPKGFQMEHKAMLHTTYKHKTNTKHRTSRKVSFFGPLEAKGDEINLRGPPKFERLVLIYDSLGDKTRQINGRLMNLPGI